MKSFVDDLSIRMAIKDSSSESINNRENKRVWREFLTFFSLWNYRKSILEAKYDRGRIIASARRETIMLQAAYAKVI